LPNDKVLTNPENLWCLASGKLFKEFGVILLEVGRKPAVVVEDRFNLFCRFGDGSAKCSHQLWQHSCCPNPSIDLPQRRAFHQKRNPLNGQPSTVYLPHILLLVNPQASYFLMIAAAESVEQQGLDGDTEDECGLLVGRLWSVMFRG
jgi:hypothetical protein